MIGRWRGWVWLVLAGLTLLTMQRVTVWQDNLTLWTDAAQKAPDKPRPHLNRRAALARDGRWLEAIEECGRAQQAMQAANRTEYDRWFWSRVCVSASP